MSSAPSYQNIEDAGRAARRQAGKRMRELTKRHETVYRSTLLEAVSYYEENLPKGECVLVIEGLSREEIEQEEQRSGVICRSKNIWSIICRRESIKKKR